VRWSGGLWCAGAFAAGFVAVGLPYWRIPYAEVSLPGMLMTPALLVIVAGAALARGSGRCGLLAVVLIAGAAAPAAVLARVAVETQADPTSHNLWPFEVVFACGPGLLAAAAGALLGSLPALLSRRAEGDA
jgi:hypothetical protein